MGDLVHAVKSRFQGVLEKTSAHAVLGTVAMIVAATAAAHAGTGGENAFGQLETQIIGWAQGYLGIILALVALLVGAGFAIARQSVIFVVVALAFAIVLYFAPGVITGILTATAGFGVVHPLLVP
ncbi:hypothetical protein JKG47_03665 [Acidithiobacillus sp. MC6.1]|nr:hypothetical protein [Acidithiobacillus sp. MC6.1]